MSTNHFLTNHILESIHKKTLTVSKIYGTTSSTPLKWLLKDRKVTMNRFLLPLFRLNGFKKILTTWKKLAFSWILIKSTFKFALTLRCQTLITTTVQSKLIILIEMTAERVKHRFFVRIQIIDICSFCVTHNAIIRFSSAQFYSVSIQMDV